MIKRLISKALQPIAQAYLSKDRRYRYQGLELVVRKGVFHPGLFFSTGILANLLATSILKGKKVLELGAGSGLLSLLAASAGATVTATDISPLSVANVRENAQRNGLTIQVIESDLFDQLPEDQSFDYILINPPFYPHHPQNLPEHAWYCGKNFDYFHRLFTQLAQRKSLAEGHIWMVLSQDCDLTAIRGIGQTHGFDWHLVKQQNGWWEKNYVFQIVAEKQPYTL